MEIISKWCISRNEYYNEPINKWFNENTKASFSSKTDYHPQTFFSMEHQNYIHYPPIDGRFIFGEIKNGYTVITHEEFDKFILNKNKGAKLLRSYKESNKKEEYQVIRK